jgi:arginyl-tRNA synthetase
MEFQMIQDDLRRQLNEKLRPWAKAHGLASLPAYALEEPPAGIEADMACNLALLLAKPLKKSPRALAEELRKALEGTIADIGEISIAGAGFLNFRWTLRRLQQELQTLLHDSSRYGRLPDAHADKILIEFVSANPTGPLHVGHGRGAALGDSLALILSHLGYPVTREYYINDAGNQVQLLGESVLARVHELQGKPFQLPPEGYHGEYIREIAKAWLAWIAPSPGKGAGVPSPTSGEGGRRPGEGTQEIIAFALERMQKNIEQDLAAFGVHFDSWFSEASVVRKGLVEKHIEQLRAKGYIQEYDGAVWFVAPGEEDVEKDKNRVLKRKDGRWTYFATDIAYHADKYERGYRRLIDVWGADHHGYVPRVKGSMQALGYDPQKLHIILNQLVSLTRNGVPVAMSKRSGEFVTLRDVVEEVGKDACRFFFALRGPNSALDFDLELAKKQSVDNPVYYLQYAHARICSIFRQAGREPSPYDFSPLKENEERDLMKRLALFPQVLGVCSQEDSPHPLANYLLLLARQFHHFYDHHRVLGDDAPLTQARLGLIDAVRNILKLGLSLLGVSAPESM